MDEEEGGESRKIRGRGRSKEGAWSGEEEGKKREERGRLGGDKRSGQVSSSGREDRRWRRRGEVVELINENKGGVEKGGKGDVRVGGTEG
ncbi:hypothetical protein, partial [Escherichia coli]|uniref:hypothetical protein n=1 Tax=Escherichia coli TaxID=562 RepID=UPI001BAF4F2F